MNVGMNTAAAAATQSTSDAAGLMMLKKANDIQAQNLMTLLNSVPQPSATSAANLPPNLGQNINTTA